MSKFIRNTATTSIALFSLLLGSESLAAEPPVFTGGDYAIRGYDAVAYHTEEKPVKGSEAYSTEWNGATWLFASEENRELFAANPERWAPKYGGYCAWAVANNYTASIDPKAWSVVDDTLYLNFSKRVRKRWSKDIPGNIQRGDANWPGVLSN